MKAFFYALLGVAAGVVVIRLAYRFISIPILPSVAVYATWYLSSFGALRHPIPSVISIGGISLYGFILWGASAYSSIAFYPAYRNVLGIIWDILTAIAFIAVALLFIPLILTESRRLREMEQ